MHDTARYYGHRFLETYAPVIKNIGGVSLPTVLEIGAGTDGAGGYEPTFSSKCKELGLVYSGVDQLHSDDPDVEYKLPVSDSSVDMVVSSSCFEHDEFFWVTFLEIMRVLKPHGVFYMSAPSNGVYHTYPVDCWRFYPDSANALAKWARKNRIPAVVLERFIGTPMNDIWDDYMGVILKDDRFLNLHTQRMQYSLPHKIYHSQCK